MVPLGMGQEAGYKGFGLALALSTPQTLPVLPTGHTDPPRIPERNAIPGYSRASEVSASPRQTLHSAETNRWFTSDSRSLSPEQVDTLPEIPYVFRPCPAESFAGRSVQRFGRRPARVLASTSGCSVPPISRLHFGWSKMEISSSPLRTFRGTSRILKADDIRYRGTSFERHQYRVLPGRYPCLALRQGIMRPAYADYGHISPIPGIPYKLGKIQVHASESVRVAGSDVGFRAPSLVSPTATSDKGNPGSEDIPLTTADYSEASPKDSGNSQLRMCSGPSIEVQAQRLVSVPSYLQAESSSSEAMPSGTEGFNVSVASRQPLERQSSIETTLFHVRHLYRCLPDGVGSPHFVRPGRNGPLACSYEGTSHKSSRVCSGLDCAQASGNPAERSRHHIFRQLYSSGDYEKGWIGEISSFKQMVRVRSSQTSTEELPCIGNSHFRGSELNSRHIVTRYSSSHGVDARRRIFSMGRLVGPVTAGRSFRNEKQSPPPAICFADAGLGSHRLRRSASELEHLDVDLSVPPDVTPAQSVSQVGELPGLRSSDSPAMAQCALVSPSTSHVLTDTTTQSNLIPDRVREDFVRRILSNPSPTRLDILGEFYKISFSSQLAPYLCANIRPSSARQYQAIWRKFTDFLKGRPSPQINIKTVMEFFVSAFETGRCQPSTIQCYKSALKTVLSPIFGLDLDSEHFTLLLRSFRLKRPTSPQKPISWDLDAVLRFTSALPLPLSPIDLASKTAFLLALALGGRISELHALTRRDITGAESDKITIFPDPLFLAKNEDPGKRFKPLQVSKLLDSKGHPLSLCPVDSVLQYLEVAPLSPEEPALFIDPTSRRPLSKYKLSLLLTRYVLRADPSSSPRTHDMRKLASSYALMSGMSTAEILRKGRWSSLGVFLKHYARRVPPATSVFIALGDPVSNQE